MRMITKNNIFLFFLSLLGSSIALHGAETQEVVVHDWSSSVHKQTANTCGFNALYNATFILDARSMGSSPIWPQGDTQFPERLLGRWQEHIGRKIDLSGDELQKLAIEKGSIPHSEFAVIDSETINTHAVLTDKRGLFNAIIALTSPIPQTKPPLYTFFCGTANPDNPAAIGHWRVCVASKGTGGKLVLDYADSMNPEGDPELAKTIRVALEAEKKECSQDEIDRQSDEIRAQTLAIMAKRRESAIDQLTQLILRADPRRLLASEIDHHLDSAGSLLTKPDDALPHFRKALDKIIKFSPLNDRELLDSYSQELVPLVGSIFDVNASMENIKDICNNIYHLPSKLPLAEIKNHLKTVFELQLPVRQVSSSSSDSSESFSDLSRSPSPRPEEPCPTRTWWQSFWDWLFCRQPQSSSDTGEIIREAQERKERREALREQAPRAALFSGFLVAAMAVLSSILGK